LCTVEDEYIFSGSTDRKKISLIYIYIEEILFYGAETVFFRNSFTAKQSKVFTITIIIKRDEHTRVLHASQEFITVQIHQKSLYATKFIYSKNIG